MTYIEPCLRRVQPNFIDRLLKPRRTTDFDRILGVLLLCLSAYALSLVIDLFVLREPVHAQELTALEVHEDWAGQTVEFCKKKLADAGV